tara:strand:- start:9656 stop:10072 length:417 start_codon:yes stop_codon:yes gene_type:complete
MDDFIEAFSRGRVLPYGAWQSHVLGWITASHRRPNVAVLRYEDLLTDGTEALQAALSRLGLEFTPDQVRSAMSNNTADAMRSKELATPEKAFREGHSSIPFVRRAASEQWRTEMLPSNQAKIEAAFNEGLRACGYVID